MHSKQTVKYICEKYPSGNCYFYKQEMITFNTWDDPSSIMWGKKRPISKKTYERRKKEGYKTTETFINKEPAEIVQFIKAHS
ncbi:hypothetical protein LGQ02_07845 [Bacillus shivajii]|uniref:hypothetical protein n=1 Tax=Bacillus shivajii TaxID=1983719 RepID=UPI001CFC2020|nr:hypothetical protein [Bacillus shivajii]UCZ54649.1 hypothetical protein LGQ02_07845 [Bacillus shivajii]